MAPGTVTTQQFGNTYITASPTSQPALFFDAELDRLQEHINLSADFCNRIGRVADRMLGAEPTPIGKGESGGAKNPDVIPVTVQFRAKQEVLQQLLTQLNYHLTRLESL